MKRMVSFGLAAAFLICIILCSGCAQRHGHPQSRRGGPGGDPGRAGPPTPCPRPSRTRRSRRTPGDSSQAPEDAAGSSQSPDSSADPSQQPDSSADASSEPENTGDLTILSQPRTQQYGSCSNYTQLDGDVTCGSTTPPGTSPPWTRGDGLGPPDRPKLSGHPAPGQRPPPWWPAMTPTRSTAGWWGC